MIRAYACLSLILGFCVPIASVRAQEPPKEDLDEMAIRRGDRADFGAMGKEQLERVQRECAALEGTAKERCEWKLRYMRERADRPQAQYRAEVERRVQRITNDPGRQVPVKETSYVVSGGRRMEIPGAIPVISPADSR